MSDSSAAAAPPQQAEQAQQQTTQNSTPAAEESTHVPAYPPPPSYYLHFPEDPNWEPSGQYYATNADNSSAQGGNDTTSTTTPPQDNSNSTNNNNDSSIFLTPPPPIHTSRSPSDMPYKMFASLMPSYTQQERQVVRPANENIRELFLDSAQEGKDATSKDDSTNQPPPNINKKAQLKRLIKSLLVNYIELLKILETNPMQRLQNVEEARFFTHESHDAENTSVQWKMQQIHLLLTNLHYLLNLYRPMQAKYQLKHILLNQRKHWERNIKLIDQFMDMRTKSMQESFAKYARKELPASTLKQESSSPQQQKKSQSTKRKRSDDDDADINNNNNNTTTTDEHRSQQLPTFMIPQSIREEFFS